MITLLLILISLALAVASAYAAAARPFDEPPIEAAIPLAGLGLQWRRLRDVQTRRGPRTLWTGDGDTEQYRRAWGLRRSTLSDAGYSWAALDRSGGGELAPVCWEDTSLPESKFTDALADAQEAVAYDDKRQAALEQLQREYEARDAEVYGDSRRADLQALRVSLDKMHWAWSKQRRELGEGILREPLGANGVPKPVVAKLARELVAQVEYAVERVRERVARDPAHDWLRMAEDPQVRATIHRATKFISANDEDRAVLENGIGWSKAHSHNGHVLASLPELSVIEASNALAALFRHRRQLRPEVRHALFGDE